MYFALSELFISLEADIIIQPADWYSYTQAGGGAAAAAAVCWFQQLQHIAIIIRVYDRQSTERVVVMVNYWHTFNTTHKP